MKLRKRYLVGVIFILFIILLGFSNNEYYMINFEKIFTKEEPKVVAFPFSWEEDGVRITILNFTREEEVWVTGRRESGGTWGVAIKVKNLLHESTYVPFKYYRWELLTNRSNKYGSHWTIIKFGYYLDPEQEIKGITWFNRIRDDEKPTEVRLYCKYRLIAVYPVILWEEERLLYIWKIQE